MITRFVLGALVVGTGLALTAASATAAPPPPPPGNFSFGIHIGPTPPPPPPPDVDDDCLSTKEIVGGLRSMGYRGFTNFDDSDDDSFTVDARKGTKWYELEVDNCSGDILDRTRIKFPG